MPLENDKLFPELFYALLKDFLGEGDGLMIGGGRVTSSDCGSPVAIPTSICKADSPQGSRWVGILSPLGPYV